LVVGCCSGRFARATCPWTDGEAFIGSRRGPEHGGRDHDAHDRCHHGCSDTRTDTYTDADTGRDHGHDGDHGDHGDSRADGPAASRRRTYCDATRGRVDLRGAPPRPGAARR